MNVYVSHHTHRLYGTFSMRSAIKVQSSSFNTWNAMDFCPAFPFTYFFRLICGDDGIPIFIIPSTKFAKLGQSTSIVLLRNVVLMWNKI